MKLTDISGRKVAILGTGREGQAAWTYLRRELPEQDLTLISEAPPDRVFLQQLTSRDTMITAPFATVALEDYEVIIRSPGISPYRRSIRAAKRHGAIVTTSSSIWFSAHPQARTIAVTGTKGKSTTSALLAHALGRCGYGVRLAGNIGLPLLACDPHGVDWWIIELSSYQLADLQAQPSVGVLLNITPEHLDWHGGEKGYRNDKLRLADLVSDGPLIVNAQDDFLCASLAERPNITWFNDPRGFQALPGQVSDGGEPLSLDLPKGLPGVHNLSNVAAALAVIRAIGADVERAKESFASFASLPHRLQTLGHRRGLVFVNDSISSTPVATVAALQALSTPWITLIIGGLDRGVDWSPHLDSIRAAAPGAIIGIPDNGGRLIQQMHSAGIRPADGLHTCGSLAEAVERAMEFTPDGGTVLLSPGAPSFPQFRDFTDRGRQFAELCGFDLDDKAPFDIG